MESSQQHQHLECLSFEQIQASCLENLQPTLQRTQMSHETRTLVTSLLYRIQLLESKIAMLEQKQTHFPKKKKKNRRKANEVPKMYKCMVSNCLKVYGSETSLKNHRKIKHGVRMFRKKKVQKGQPTKEIQVIKSEF